LLEELGAERRERAEHERSLAVDAAGVEVRNGHGRRTHGGLRVDLRLVLRDELRVGRLEELPADREDAVALDLGDPGALQELDGPAARADEDEPRVDPARRAADPVAVREVPRAVALLAQLLDLVVQAQLGALLLEVREQLARDRAEVDVGSGLDARRRERLALAALLHE